MLDKRHINTVKLPKTPRNIIISHVYSSGNKGDAALASVLIQDIQRIYPHAAISIVTLDPRTPMRYFEGVPEKPSFMYYALNRFKHPMMKLAYMVFMISVTLLWALVKKRTGRSLYLPEHLLDVADRYERSDLVVAVGGGYMRSRAGLMNRVNVPLILHPLLFAFLLGKPTVLYPQSVGPFQNAIEEQMVAYVLRRMSLILLREDTSKKLVANMGVRHNVKRAIDSGFLLKAAEQVDVRKKYDIPEDAMLIGVTVRAWLGGEAQQRYEKEVAAALDNAIQLTTAHILFIPQVTAGKGDDDRVVSRRVQSLMHNTTATTLITDELDTHQIKSVYDGLDLLIGTRFHSVIFSLTAYVPVIAIEYEHKTSGIMHDLALDAWVIRIEDVNVLLLTRLLERIIKHQNAYRRHLQIAIPPYKLKAEYAATDMAAAYINGRNRMIAS